MGLLGNYFYFVLFPFKSGYTLFGFDISPASCNGGHQEVIKRGTIRISIEVALPNTVTIIWYADFKLQLIKPDRY